MFVAPLAIAQPASFVAVQNQPTVSFTLRAPEQSSPTQADLEKALRALLNQNAQQAPASSCNKSSASQAPRAPVPPPDHELELKVTALEGRLTDLQTRLDQSLGETNEKLEKILAAMKQSK